MNINLNQCPTCRQKKIEKAPGVWTWPQSTYRLDGIEHNCNCEWQDNLRRHYLLAGIPTDYWTLSRNDFFGDSKALAAADKYLERWDDWKFHGIGIEFYSPVQGTGKTMLATLIAKALIKCGEKVYFIMFRDAIGTYNLPEEERDERERRLRNTPVLVLDEVTEGYSRAQKEFFATGLEDLIRFRSNGNGVTIITTNLMPEELDHEYPRTFSLLADKVQKVMVGGQDARRSGDVNLVRMDLITKGEARPIR